MNIRVLKEMGDLFLYINNKINNKIKNNKKIVLSKLLK